MLSHPVRGAVSVSVFEPEEFYFTNNNMLVKIIMGFLWEKYGMKFLISYFTIKADSVIKLFNNERSF